MQHSVRVVADSISHQGVRLTSLLCVFPRIILAEVNTHRMISKNSASSRAIPIPKMIAMAQETPYVPTVWGRNQKGMQAAENLSEAESVKARDGWLRARDSAVDHAKALLDLDVHKQLANRLLEPFMWHTALLTATEWSNMFHLRNNGAAHPDFQAVMAIAESTMAASTPRIRDDRAWHLPFIDPLDPMYDGPWPTAGVPHIAKISTARCARTSYLTQDGQRDISEDEKLHDRLLAPGHLSPFEHPARPMSIQEMNYYRRKGDGAHVVPFLGNFKGWVQYRKVIPGEEDILAHRKRSGQAA
jgi:thymidylate synthase ThyX